MNLPLINQLKTETRVFRYFYVKDILIITFFGCFGMILDSAVHYRLETAFLIFNLIVAISLVIKSKSNPGKRVYEAILIMLYRDKNMYKPVFGERKVLDRKENNDEV